MYCGNIKYICFNDEKIFFLSQYNGECRVYSKIIKTNKLELLFSERANSSFFFLYDNFIFLGLDYNNSRFYFQAFKYNINNKRLVKLSNEIDDKVNEYISCVINNNIYMATNKNNKINNDIVCFDNNNIIQTIKKGDRNLTILLDVSPNEKYVCYMNVLSNFYDEIYLLDRNEKKETCIAGEKILSSNYNAKFLSNNIIIFISDYKSDRQYLSAYYIKEKLHKKIIEFKEEDISEFCICREKSDICIKTEDGVKDNIYIYNFSNNKISKLTINDITIIDSIYENKGVFYLIGKNERIRSSIYKIESDNTLKIIHENGLYENQLESKLLRVKTINNFIMEMLFYKSDTKEKGTVLWIHGGPNSAVCKENINIFSYFTKKGYNVLAPNYIGSSRYGKRYASYIEENGDFKSIIKNIDDGLNYASDKGFIDLNNIIVCGESYGGYIAFCMVISSKIEMKLSINMFGPTNIKKLINSMPKYLNNVSSYKNSLGLYKDKEFISTENKKSTKGMMILIKGEKDKENKNDEFEMYLKEINNKKIMSYTLNGCGHGCKTKKEYEELKKILDKWL